MLLLKRGEANADHPQIKYRLLNVVSVLIAKPIARKTHKEDSGYYGTEGAFWD